MDTEEEYSIGKAIVKSQHSEEWDFLRNSKGDWPEDKKAWKSYRNYSMEELKVEMKLYKQSAASAGQSALAPNVSAELADFIERKFVDFSIALHPEKIKITHWISGKKLMFDYYQHTSFNSFVNQIMDRFSMDSTVIFVLPAPDHNWNNKQRLNENMFRQVVSSVINNPPLERPSLYAHPGEKSPESSPVFMMEGNDEISSIGSGATDRSGQADFKSRTMFCDNDKCVFCDFSGQPLYAAHILPFSHYRTASDKFKEYGLTGINDTCNGFTLCWNCHQAFDNGLVCICPDSGKLLVSEALVSSETLNWEKLNGKSVDPPPSHWPNKKLLSYRHDVMIEKTNQRKTNRETYPYVCSLCNQ